MSQWMLTLGLAFFLVFVAILCLGIGWLITGKTRVRGGMCGRDPTKKEDSCDDTEDKGCSVCHKEPKKK